MNIYDMNHRFYWKCFSEWVTFFQLHQKSVEKQSLIIAWDGIIQVLFLEFFGCKPWEAYSQKQTA